VILLFTSHIESGPMKLLSNRIWTCRAYPVHSPLRKVCSHNDKRFFSTLPNPHIPLSIPTSQTSRSLNLFINRQQRPAKPTQQPHRWLLHPVLSPTPSPSHQKYDYTASTHSDLHKSLIHFHYKRNCTSQSHSASPTAKRDTERNSTPDHIPILHISSRRCRSNRGIRRLSCRLLWRYCHCSKHGFLLNREYSAFHSSSLHIRNYGVLERLLRLELRLWGI